MKTGRKIFITAILSLSAAGAILPAVVPAVSTASVVASAPHATSNSFYHGAQPG